MLSSIDIQVSVCIKTMQQIHDFRPWKMTNLGWVIGSIVRGWRDKKQLNVRGK